MCQPFWMETDKLSVVVDEYMANLCHTSQATSSFIGQGNYRRSGVPSSVNFAAAKGDSKPD